jgi:hypothetical protein
VLLAEKEELAEEHFLGNYWIILNSLLVVEASGSLEVEVLTYWVDLALEVSSFLEVASFQVLEASSYLDEVHLGPSFLDVASFLEAAFSYSLVEEGRPLDPLEAFPLVEDRIQVDAPSYPSFQAFFLVVLDSAPRNP